MFSVVSFFVIVSWIGEHITEILIGLAAFILLVVTISRRQRAVNRARAAVRSDASRQAAPASRPAPPAAAAPVPADPAPVISLPLSYQDKNRVYSYDDVKIVPVPGGASLVRPGEPLAFSCSPESVKIFQGSNCIGEMVENRLAGMVRDWEKAGDPVLGYVLKYSDDGSSAMIALAFYQDLLARFLKKNPGAKPYKLAGKPDDLASDYVPGSVCSVESDFDDPEKYNVMFEYSSIGRLPASAIRYAEEQGCSPEDLRVIVASVDYDLEKDRDVISVYLD